MMSVFSNSKLKVDSEALKILPGEIKELYPVVVKGDENYLPRAASVLVSGNENQHVEMRARITLELIRNRFIHRFQLSSKRIQLER